MIIDSFRVFFLKHEIVRFLIVGGFNTALSLSIYWILLNWLSYPVAYTISFLAGIISGYSLNTLVVFGRRWSWLKLLGFPSVHAINYIAGMAVMWISINVLGISEFIAPALSTLVVFPLNFFITRRFIRWNTADG